jgi:hypothetical protein
MVQPYDYSLNVPSPFEAFTSGIKTGQAGLEAQARRRQLEAQQAAAEQAAAQQHQVERLLDDFYTVPSYDKAMRLSQYLPKDQYANLISGFESKTKQQQQNELLFGGQVMSALVGGNADVAVRLLEQRAEALGDDAPEGQSYRQAAELAKADPEGALGIVSTLLAVLPGSKDIIDRAFAAKAAPLIARKTDLEIQDLERKLRDAEKAAEQETNSNVQSSKILDDGTTINVMRDGSTIVRSPDGQIVKGADAAKAIREAQDYGATLQQLREGARTFGRETTKVNIDQGRQALETIPKVRDNIANLKRAKELADDGAQTGVIAERFPSWKASTIELKNLQKQLGINVINSATFGALSEAELALALETALPTRLDQKDLSNWLQRKIDAQEKLAAYMENAALFFLDGGSAADWLKQEQEKAKGGQPAEPANTQGFSIRGVRQ